MSEPVITDDEVAEEPGGDDGEAAKTKRRRRVFEDWVLVIGVALLVAFSCARSCSPISLSTARR